MAAEAARRLSLSVRALTYRLERIHKLTGANPADPAHRYMLQTAVIGALIRRTGPPRACDPVGSAVFGVLVVAVTAGVPRGALVAVCGNATEVLQRPGQVQQVPVMKAVLRLVKSLPGRPSRGRDTRGLGPASPIISCVRLVGMV